MLETFCCKPVQNFSKFIEKIAAKAVEWHAVLIQLFFENLAETLAEIISRLQHLARL